MREGRWVGVRKAAGRTGGGGAINYTAPGVSWKVHLEESHAGCDRECRPWDNMFDGVFQKVFENIYNVVCEGVAWGRVRAWHGRV